MLPQTEQIFWPIVFEEKTFNGFSLYLTMEKFTLPPFWPYYLTRDHDLKNESIQPEDASTQVKAFQNS